MIELKEISGKEFYEYQGAMNLPNGEKPMIAEGKVATLILSGFEGNDFENGISISIIPKEYVLDEGFLNASKYYVDIEKAKLDAIMFAQMLDYDVTEKFWDDHGFMII